MTTEPAQIIGWLTGAATAVIALLVAFGLDLDQTQQAAILGVVAVVAPVVAGLVIRSKVFAPDTVQSIARQAANTGKVPDRAKL
jgi:ABC-type enterobactin transport system permease subunit